MQSSARDDPFIQFKSVLLLLVTRGIIARGVITAVAVGEVSGAAPCS